MLQLNKKSSGQCCSSRSEHRNIGAIQVLHTMRVSQCLNFGFKHLGASLAKTHVQTPMSWHYNRRHSVSWRWFRSITKPMCIAAMLDCSIAKLS